MSHASSHSSSHASSLPASHIVSIHGTRATIKVEAPSACSNCRSQSACGSGITREITLPPELAKRLRVGDAVTLRLPEHSSLHAALLAYVVPLIGFLGGFALLALRTEADGWRLLGGLAGMVPSFWLAQWITQRIRLKLQPEVFVASD